MKIFELKKSDRQTYQDQIAALEKLAVYPLGSDAFRIDHGKDYFAFFDRLGEVHYFLCIVDGIVVAVAAGIIRNIPKKVFYLCDLKVHPKYRGRKIPLKILGYASIRYYLKCPRGYAISMDNEKQHKNRVATLLGKFRWIKISPNEKLYIYSFTSDEILRHRKLIEHYKGPITFLSLLGVKDLVLESSKAPLPLLHIQYNEQGKTNDTFLKDPMEGHVHMIALTTNDSLKKELDLLNIPFSSSATIIGHNMKIKNWDFIRTSDI